MNRLPLFALSIILHGYVGWRVIPDLSAWPVAAILFAVLLLASAVSMPIGLMASRRKDSDALSWIGLLFMGLFSSLFVLTFLRDLMLFAFAIVEYFWPGTLALDALRIDSAAAVPLLALLATAWGFLNARRTAAVVTVDVPIADLPSALEGFTIAQISDVHVGPTIKSRYVQAIVDRVNAMNADAVAITGDLVDGSVPQLRDHVAPIGNLKSRHGSFFVTGNHEYYSGASAWIHELRRIGVTVLSNQHVVLQQNGESVVLGGVTDSTAHHFDPADRSDAKAAMSGAPLDAGARVLLAHQPRSAGGESGALAAGFDLQLSGHTHGGQFWPWNHFVRLQQPFTAGLQRLGNLWVYTSRGTGYWGPPKRFGAPSEITRVRLVRA